MTIAIGTASRLTPKGRGAVASILVRGDLDSIASQFQPFNGLPIAELKFNRIYYGLWGTEHQEDVVGIKLDDETFEIHCHGGSIAVERILSDLKKSGVTIQNETNIQANANPLAYEFEDCLQRATTQRTAHILLRQSELFPNELEKLKSLNTPQRNFRIQEMLLWSEFGRHLFQPWQVVLCGSPNVGKSSLINALVGYSRSVVYDQPGTTRDVVTVQTALEGWPIEFSDTAGLRETTASLESIGIEKAKEKIQNADLLIVVLDASDELKEIENDLLESPAKTLLVLNKIDLAPNRPLPNESLSVSATESTGINELAMRIVKQLMPTSPSKHQAFPVSQRQIDMLQELLEPEA
ncbi:MAG: GTP-binding protein [Planctomicrobium sp.]|jgi:tRNA modification GTPase|nr:GTP-binding protein [Planctomicrobium sp.]